MANYSKIIKDLREQKGFSQLQVSEKLGLSRPSYIAIEQGKRDLTWTEAQTIAGILGITLQDLEQAAIPNYEKYKEMILAYLRTGVSKDGKIPKTKLAKLLYLADFSWFYDHLTSMSGMAYRRIQYGPVPDMYFRALDELENEGKITVDRSREDLALISENKGSSNRQLELVEESEKRLIDAIAKKWKDKRTSEIVDFTHNQIPYKICAPDEVIPYELITQEDPDNVY